MEYLCVPQSVKARFIALQTGGMHSRQAEIGESSLDILDKLLANAPLQINLLVFVPLTDTSIPPNRADVDHAIPELDECTSLDGNIQVCHIMQDESHELLVVVLANPLDERMRGQRLAHTVGGQTVLGEAEVEECGDGDGGGAELFLLLGEVRAADEANGDFVTQSGEELEHFGRYSLSDGTRPIRDMVTTL